MNACRIHMPTTPDKRRMVKYAARHWAHYRCWIFYKLGQSDARYKLETVVNVLATLNTSQLHEFPILALQDVLHSYGHTENPIVVLRAAIWLAQRREGW